MRRLPLLFGMGVLALTLLVGADAAQDAKKETKKDGDKKETGKAKGFLPPGFKDLNLSAEQKAKVYTIQADYKAKIAELDAKIKELKKQENMDVFKVLTDDQREKYLKAKGLDSKDKK